MEVFADDFEIKSLRVYQTHDETSFPIVFPNSKIAIEFDIKSDFTPNWEIHFKFCNQDWEPYQDYLFANEFYSKERNLYYDVLPFRSDRARYHYKDYFPNDNVNFPFSGKWQFFIVDSNNSEFIYGSGKFYVIGSDEVKLLSTLRNQRLEGLNPEPVSFGQINYMSISFQLPDTLFTQNVINVEIVENRKIEYPIIIPKTYEDQWRFYEVEGYKSLSFHAKDIQPGGEYRQANLMSQTKHNPPKTYANFEGVDISNKFNPSGSDFNGASKLMHYKREYAEYMDVEFRLRLPEGYYENVFLVGAFNNWEILPDYLMENADGLFTKTIELKRGIYDYQYVTAEINADYLENESWIELEGNDWNTKNEYYIFLYYNTPELGGYEKIIGYVQINSGSK